MGHFDTPEEEARWELRKRRALRKLVLNTPPTKHHEDFRELFDEVYEPRPTVLKADPGTWYWSRWEEDGVVTWNRHIVLGWLINRTSLANELSCGIVTPSFTVGENVPGPSMDDTGVVVDQTGFWLHEIGSPKGFPGHAACLKLEQERADRAALIG